MVVLSIIGIVVFQHLLTEWFEDYVTDELKAQLNTAVMQLRKDNPPPNAETLNAYVNKIPKVNRDERFTIIRDDGKVLADSSLPVELVDEMDDHKSRPEIIQALKDGKGQSIRYSDTLNVNLLYVANKLEFGEFKGAMRISTPLSHLKGIVFELTVTLIILLTITLIIVAVLAFYTNRYIQDHVDQDHLEQEKRVSDRTQQIELLHRLTTMLAACNSIKEAQTVIADVVPRILGPLNGAVSLIRSDRKHLEVELDWGGMWPGAHSYSADECWALRKGKYHLANDELTKLPCTHMSEVGDDQTLCIPLIAQGSTIGMMHFYLAEKTFSNDRLQLCFTIAEQVGLALANLILQEKLLEQAIRDPLTNLYNRRYLEEHLEQEIMRANRQAQPFSILAIDLDYFKRFNDDFGHDAGDYVLKWLGAELIKMTRGEDIACRVGGEELAILLPLTNTEAAKIVADKICHIARNASLSFNGTRLGDLSLSIGLATFPLHADDATSLLKQADIALYKAKTDGRDRVCIAEQMEVQTDQAKANLIPLADNSGQRNA